MKKNIGTTDKLIRLVTAAIIAILYITKVIEGTLGIVLLLFAVILSVTALINVCGIYALFGRSTCPNK